MNNTLSKFLIVAVAVTVLGAGVSVSRPAQAAEPFIGQIQYFPYSFAPRSWTDCNGQLLQIAQNTALFSLFGTIYGGDGRTTFGIPDMRGRGPLHQGTGPGLTNRRIGQSGGSETVTLSLTQIPSHRHSLNAHNDRRGSNTPDPTGAVLANDRRDETYSSEVPDTVLHSDSITATGGGQAHDNMAPFLTVRCSVALQGTFPSRS